MDMKSKDKISILSTWLRRMAERLTRGETALDPNTPENREKWNTVQVNNHESLFPFNDSLTSDLSEAERETHKFPFSTGKGYPRLCL